MAQVTGKAFDLKLFTRVLKYVAPYKRIFYLSFFLTILLAGLAVIRPILIGDAIDEYVVTGDSSGLLFLMLLVTGILFVEAAVQFYQTYYSNWLGQSVTIDRSQWISNNL